MARTIEGPDEHAPRRVDEEARAILARSVEAHGGTERWARANRLHLELAIGGLALSLKGRSPHQRRMTAALSVHHPLAELSIGERRFRMTGRRIEELDREGSVLRAKDVRAREGRHRTPLLWSVLHEAHFLGYAVWNYGLGPWLLLQRATGAERLEPLDLGGRTCERVRVRLPDDVPTHAPVQDFWFDGAGRLARLDYTAHALSRWALGGHEVQSFGTFGDIVLPSRRRVWLRPFGGTKCARILPLMQGRILDARLEDR